MVYVIAGIVLVCFSVVLMAVAGLAIYISKDVSGIQKHVNQLEMELQVLHAEHRELINRIERVENMTRQTELKQVRVYK